MLSHLTSGRVRHPLVWSPVAATLLQLLLATAVAAVTGGGDFPVRG